MEQRTFPYEPFTYYRNTKEQRAFLLYECPTPICFALDYVTLIEWGKKGYKRIPVATFTDLVQAGTLELFTPKFQ